MNVLAISKHGKALSDISKSTRPTSQQIDEKRPFFSRMFLLWVGNLLSRGASSNLVYDDLTALKQKYRSVNLLRQWKKRNFGPKSHIVWNLIWHYKLGIMAAFLTRILSIAFDYINPFLLKLLIDSVNTPSSSVMKGIIISILMFISGELKSILMAFHNYISNRDTSLAMALLTNSIAKKSLKLSGKARHDWPTSRIVNLIAVDLELFSVAAPIVHSAWACIVEIAISMLYLYHILGTAAWGAIIVMVAYIPVNVCINIIIRRIQSEQMKIKEKRVKFMKEIISGIKVVKLYAWEPPFEEELEKLRVREIKLIAKSSLLSRCIQGLNSGAPILVAIVSLSWFVWSHGTDALTPQVAFVSFAIFNLLRTPMTLLVPSLYHITKAKSSIANINKFLHSSVLVTEKPTATSNESQEISVVFHHATFSWDLKPTVLSDICLNVEEGKFHAIIGPVASGKSSLLSAVLGELTLLSGHRMINGSLAYVPQVPWILNANIRSNILYGQEFEKNRYEKVVRACELKKDFYNFPRYDSTVIGENKIPLSGSQVARIGLARALYQNCDIYLLDDSFASVNTEVSKAMYNKILGPDGLLAKKTVILVTNNMSMCKDADVIHIMDEGRIVDSGTFEEITENNPAVLESCLKPVEHPVEGEVKKQRKKTRAVMFEPSFRDESRRTDGYDERRVKPRVFMTYLEALSYRFAGLLVVLLLIRGALQALWVMVLARVADIFNENDNVAVSDFNKYIYLGIATILVGIVAIMSSTLGGTRASYMLHRPLVAALLRAPQYFFDKTPIEGIISRVSSDLDVIDGVLPITLRLVLETFINLIMVVVVISISVPFFLIFCIPFAIGYYFLINRYLPSCRQIKRIECTQRSNLLATLSQNIRGASTIRAFGRIKTTNLHFGDEVDSFLRCRYLQPAIQQWLSLRLELLGNMMVFVAAILVTVFHQIGWISVGEVGLCVALAFTITHIVNFSVRAIGRAENYLLSVERIREYHDLPMEDEWKSEYPLIDAWPHTGCIEMLGYNMYYDKDVHALKDATFVIKGGEKIAIVGRPGSGKSSIANAILRLVEADTGKITIDGVDISDIGLHELRNRITVIPQEPILFSSTFRFNLDPFSQYADSDLWLALEACRLKDLVSKQNKGLLWEVEEGGANLSVGERQLICLCRALLRGGQIIILDEATSSVDNQTDKLICEVINSHFKHATTLMITHRLSSIEQCHRVMCLEEGQIIEFDKPDVLLEKENSLFREMFNQ